MNCLGCCNIAPTAIMVSVPLFPQAYLPMFTPTVDTEPDSKNTQQTQQAMIAPQNVSSWKFLACSSSHIHFLAQLELMAVKSLRSVTLVCFFSKFPQQIFEVPGHILVNVARSQCAGQCTTVHCPSCLPKLAVLFLKARHQGSF